MPNTAHEIILSYMNLSENPKQQGYAQLREALRLSWYKLFKSTRESILRKWVEIENGIAKYPETAENILGLYTIDDCGDLRPLYEDNLKSTLPIPNAKCSCNSSDHLECLCPTITESEAVTVDVVINNVPYTNKYFTRILKNGNVVEEKYEWVASYKDNAFVEAVQLPSQKLICKLELNSCGCPAITEENVKKLCGCGCFDSCCAPFVRERYPAFYNEFGYYKQDDVNRRIHVFDSNGKKSKMKWVEIKYQSNGEDMVVPDYAFQPLLALLNWMKMLYSPYYTRNDRDEAKRNYNREKREMLRYLNPIPWEMGMQGYPALPVGRGRRGVQWSNNTMPQISEYAVAPTVCAPSVVPQTIINNQNINNYNQYRNIDVFVDGEEGSPVAGQTEWVSEDLVGVDVKSIPFILVTGTIEYTPNDFTINPVLGKLTRPNSQWFEEQRLTIPLFKIN